MSSSARFAPGSTRRSAASSRLPRPNPAWLQRSQEVLGVARFQRLDHLPDVLRALTGNYEDRVIGDHDGQVVDADERDDAIGGAAAEIGDQVAFRVDENGVRRDRVV